MKVSIDSRTVEAGDTFIPVQGAHFNGRDFIPDAIKKGARVLDVDLTTYAKQYRKKLRCAVLAITGSAGKTTTKDMLAAVLSTRYKVVKTEENQNNEIGVPLTILKADFDTDILILEMGMRGLGQIAHLSKIARPSHAVITNVGLTHVELVGSQKKIAQAKSELFQAALVWERKPRLAFLNYSSAYYEYAVKRATVHDFQVFPFGGQDGPEQNMNACFVVGRQFGLSDEEIRTGLLAYSPSSHRMVRHSLRNQIMVLDDSYNANPDGVAYALQQLRHYSGRKILVLGDMLELGAHSAAEHARVVEYAIDAGVELMFTYGTETKVIASDSIWVAHFEDQNRLISQLGDELKSGDTVLIKGSRGMKMERVVDAIRIRLQ
jgi:UDP-N-acetylmuramoyl-tripeptide--D-alanyl-D-alanine ligase